MADDKDKLAVTPEEEIFQEAKKRFAYCVERESTARGRFDADLKFAEGDSDNGYQWPDNIKTNRDTDERPCLTVNRLRQHNLQIINDAKQNKMGIKIRATGGAATAKSADVFASLVRHIEYVSRAHDAYGHAFEYQVKAGIGWWRVITGFVDDETFDQECRILKIKDPKSVFMDPDMVQKDGSDARYAFVFDDVPRDVFKEQYPKLKDVATRRSNLSYGGWITKDHIRVAEYYRVVEKDDALALMDDPKTGESITIYKSRTPKQVWAYLEKKDTTRARPIKRRVVEWFKLVGDEVIDRRDWPGKYIPLIRVIGEETVIDGEIDRKGHTRAMKDAQRIYNYNSSASVEFGALQSKSPWVGPIAAFENFENMWKNANSANYAYLPFNHIDDNDNPIPAPARPQPPQSAPAFLDGMKIAADEMRAASGQNESEMGMQGNERTGRAINAKQRQGENATYHFTDNQAVALRHTGAVLIDLIPKIYDTERVIRISDEDGAESELMVNPEMKQALIEKRNQQGMIVQRIFNPAVGKYEVQADVGPAYATQREEAFNAISLVLTQSPELTNVVGDYLFKAADFPFADKIAERLRRLVPPAALGEEAPPAVKQLEEQVKQAQGVIATMAQQLADAELKSVKKDAENVVKVYDAITKRLGIVLSTLETVYPKMAAKMAGEVGGEVVEGKDVPSVPATGTGSEGAAPGSGPTPELSLGLPEPMRQAVSNAATAGAGNAQPV